MAKHIHAELMMQYAQDAMETDKPKMLSVTLMNGEVVSWPEPYTGALLLGTSYYWSVGLTVVNSHTWGNSHIEQLIKAQGLLYLVKEDAKEALVARQLIFTQGMK